MSMHVHARVIGLHACAFRDSGRCLCLSGANALGSAVMLLFFVTIGAAAGSINALLQTGWLAAFIAVQLAVHMVVTLAVGRLAGLPMEVSPQL